MAQVTIAAVSSRKRESPVRYAGTYVIAPIVLLKQLPRVHLLSSRSSQACALLALHIRGA